MTEALNIQCFELQFKCIGTPQLFFLLILQRGASFMTLVISLAEVAIQKYVNS